MCNNMSKMQVLYVTESSPCNLQNWVFQDGCSAVVYQYYAELCSLLSALCSCVLSHGEIVKNMQ